MDNVYKMLDTMHNESHFLTTQEAARRLKLNPATLQRWIKQGRIPAIDLGGSAGYRIRAEDLEGFLDERHGDAATLLQRASIACRLAAEKLREQYPGPDGDTALGGLGAALDGAGAKAAFASEYLREGGALNPS